MRSRSPWDPKVAMSCSTNPLGRPGSARTGLRSPRRSSSPTGSRTWAVGVLELGDHFLRVGHEVWADVTAIKLQALHDVELGCQGFGFLDRYHPLVANPLHRLRHHPADPDIAIGADRRDLRDLLTGRDLPRPLAHIVDDHTHGHIDAALQIHRVHPGDHCLGTLMGDRLSQKRRRGGAAPASSPVLTATSLSICAPMFSNRSASSISLATATPSLLIRGGPKDLSSKTLRPLGPRVTLTASARVSTPRSIFSRAAPPKRTSFAAIARSSVRPLSPGLARRPR